MESCYVAQAGFKLLDSSDPPASAFQVAGATDVPLPLARKPFWKKQGSVSRGAGHTLLTQRLLGVDPVLIWGVDLWKG
jgi:hypothetical protein